MIPIQGCCMPNRNRLEQCFFSVIHCGFLQQMRSFQPLEHLDSEKTPTSKGQKETEVRQCHWKVSKLTKDLRLKGFQCQLLTVGVSEPWAQVTVAYLKWLHSTCDERLALGGCLYCLRRHTPQSMRSLVSAACLSFLWLRFPPPTQPLISYQEVSL